MIVKSRVESLELQILRMLNARMNLSPKDYSNYLYLEKGYEGEVTFDHWMEEVEKGYLVVNDLILEYGNTKFQIDSLFISKIIHLFEVKYFEGDYFIEGDRWYTNKGVEIKNPLHQMERAESLLRRMVRDLGFNINIESTLVFVNPNFYLYQAPRNLPIIFPNQIPRLQKNLQKQTAPIKNTHNNLAERLLSLHTLDSPYKRLPEYSYESLKKGIACSHCHTVNTIVTRKTLICTSCGKWENIHEAVLRSVRELQLLFPKEELTVNKVHEWCNSIKTKKPIRKTLLENFTLTGSGRATHYVSKGE
ncbi:nuclease-related domain-containing protein [Mesobacillus selenatarsenatis]|uniref:NERD domain-containing protein n=1 Tax=Mesobacillus selenatarsenatis TaxID=388741 RepID=A0A846TEK7_9BACI|nr:nuclease-related domain-containing protein [Mesobacillus selenatarsenatis]NKE07518.1 NERD domain-containing protein [Mesobacillus selenatarsenatis]